MATTPRAPVRRRPVSLDRLAPLEPFVTPDPVSPDRIDAARLARIEELLAGFMADADAREERLKALERERDEVKNRLRGAVWAFNFVIGTLVLGALSLWGQLRDVWPK